MASTSAQRKRKVTDKRRTFQEKWTSYFFVEIKNKPICLIYNEAVSVLKEFNLRRHYETKHATKIDNFQDHFRKDKIKELQRNLHAQQNVFKNMNSQAESYVKASYELAQIIAKKVKTIF